MAAFDGQYRELVENAPAGIFHTDQQGRCTYTNPGWQHIFNMPMEQSLGEGWSERLHPEDAQAVYDSWMQTVQCQGSYHRQFRLLLPGEITRHIKVHANPIRNNQNILTGYVGYVEDITELHHIQNALRDSEERFALAIAGSHSGIWDWDVKSGRVYYGKELKEELGYTDKNFPNEFDAFFNHLHPEDRETVSQALRRHFSRENIPYKVQYRIRHQQGHYLWYEAVGQALKDRHGRAYRMAGSHKNISEDMATHKRLLLANMVFENSGEAIVITDHQGMIQMVNPAFSLLTGYEQDEAIGQGFHFLNSSKNPADNNRQMLASLTAHGYWSGEAWAKHKDGSDFAINAMINSIREKEGESRRYIALFTDITDKKHTQELIWQQAHYDNLTQLLNRNSFTQYLNDMVNSSLPFALLFIDLDHFKQVNDTLGHNIGDELLQMAAQRIKHCVRASDIVSRFGGDEFTVILSGTKNITGIKRICHDITHQLAEPFLLNDEDTYISASIGITQYPLDSSNVEDLYKYADQAMYDAKRAGRNRYAFFTQELQDKANKQRKISSDLRIALEQNEFKVLYQPIVNLSTQHIYKAEALIRWQHPVKGQISPAEFIPIAEENGLIIEIGDLVFKQAAMQAKVWRKHFHPDFQVSINKSPVQFYNGNVRNQENWSEFLKTINLPGNGITVEITEGLLLDSVAVVRDKLSDFHESGMQISLDDFGTGYSALSYLKKFDIDFIKIDQSFVKNIEQDAYDLVLCETIISMAHKLGMKVIAEGIETQQQMSFLSEAGCDYGQGYFFSRPISAHELTALLSKQ